MTEEEKMLSGKIYDATEKNLSAKRLKAHKLSKMYNDKFEDETEKRQKIIDELVPHKGENTFFQGPVYFDYGEFSHFGKRCIANFNFTVLDCCPVTVGDDVFFGPNCSVVTAIHPMISEERKFYKKKNGELTDDEYAAPIIIEDGCWFATGTIVCGGVTVGKGSVIGAGSVVVRDIPAGVFAAGNPCKVIRKITKTDSIKLKKELW